MTPYPTSNIRNRHKITGGKYCQSFWDRLGGLLNKKLPSILMFHSHFGIHTFGLGKKIDVLVLDKKMAVVKLKENLTPYKFYFYNPKYSIVIELPSGYIHKNLIKVGDKIEWC